MIPGGEFLSAEDKPTQRVSASAAQLLEVVLFGVPQSAPNYRKNRICLRVNTCVCNASAATTVSANGPDPALGYAFAAAVAGTITIVLFVAA